MDESSILTTIVAIAGLGGGLIAAWKAVLEMSEGRRWKKAEAASKLIDQIYDNPMSRDALVMLDWNGRPFQLDPSDPPPGVPIMHQDIFNALRIDDDRSNDLKAIFIRTRIDRLFEMFDRVGHALRTGLIEFTDVEYALEFYVARRLAQHKPIVLAFMRAQGFVAALDFFERSEAWRNAQEE